MTGVTAMDAKSIATEALSVLGQGRQISPFSSRDPAFGLDEAYKVTPIVRQMREARGERVLGRKIGFTNSTIWAQYNVNGPIWGYMYDRTIRNLSDIGGTASLAELTDPRIEPEIVIGLSAAPDAAMSERDLLSSIGWVALGYEIVQSIYPDWKFAASDTVAAFGLHGAMLIGEPHPGVEQRRSMDEAAFGFRRRTRLQRRRCGSRPCAQRAGRPAIGLAPFRRCAGEGRREPGPRGGRNRHHRHIDARAADQAG